MQRQVRNIEVNDAVKGYILAICRATRDHELIELGVSPRASQMLLIASSALALLSGRSYVIPDDVQALAHDVLDHRIILKPQARGRGVTDYDVIEEVIKGTVAPR